MNSSDRRIFHLSKSDTVGGAARAAFRLHSALREGSERSYMLVDNKLSSDPNVQTVDMLRSRQEIARLRPGASILANKLLGSAGTRGIMRSANCLPRRSLLKRVNDEADLVHLHWINAELLAIEDIAKIDKPMVWTMHDMWPFLGADHYSDTTNWAISEADRARKWPDRLDSMVFRRKQRAFAKLSARGNLTLVSPSRWLADLARHSQLFYDFSITVIPNCIDCDLWRPRDKGSARKLFGLPENKRLLLFGAFGGERDPRKGFEELTEALRRLKNVGTINDLELIVLGGEKIPSADTYQTGFLTHHIGNLVDEQSLALLFNSSDLVAVPSQLDNLPNIGLEAFACGVPLVAFDVGGLSDIVDDNDNGWLVRPYSVEAFSGALHTAFSDNSILEKMGRRARSKAVLNWSNSVVSKQYQQVYDAVWRMIPAPNDVGPPSKH